MPTRVLLARRFRPFPQPRERRAFLFVVDGEQRLQRGDRLRRQTLDKAFVSALAGKSARRQGDFLQGDGGRQQNALVRRKCSIIAETIASPRSEPVACSIAT